MNESLTRREAQRRADRIRAFREELADLERERALQLSDDQRSRLEGHLQDVLSRLARDFDVDTTDSLRRISWGMRIASTLGGLALCAALILFFNRIWGLMTTPLQVSVLVLAPMLALAATEFSFRHEKTPYYSFLLSLVAIAAFILNLNAVGMIFNLAPTPHALLLWGVFALLVAYRYGFRLPLLAGLALLIGYAAAGIMVWNGWYWQDFARRPETVLAGAAAVFAIPALLPHRALPAFAPVFRFVGMAAMFLAVLILSTAKGFSGLPMDMEHARVLYQVLGLTAAAGAAALGVRRSLPELVNLGSLFFVVFLYIRLYDWWWDWMPKYLFCLILGLLSLALLALFARIRARVSRRTP
jgi:uncharacterized membrane protein